MTWEGAIICIVIIGALMIKGFINGKSGEDK